MENKGTASSITGFVCGIISIVAAMFYYISIPAGVIGIVFSVKGIKKSKSKLARAGLVLSIIGLALCLLMYIFIITVIVADGM